VWGGNGGVFVLQNRQLQLLHSGGERPDLEARIGAEGLEWGNVGAGLPGVAVAGLASFLTVQRRVFVFHVRRGLTVFVFDFRGDGGGGRKAELAPGLGGPEVGADQAGDDHGDGRRGRGAVFLGEQPGAGELDAQAAGLDLLQQAGRGGGRAGGAIGRCHLSGGGNATKSCQGPLS
jgi:hypothetical protein